MQNKIKYLFTIIQLKLNAFRHNIISFSHKYLKTPLLYLLGIFGGLLLTFGFYIRFIRERLPRDIPFMLTEFWFYSVLTICLIYLYAIKQTINPKNPPNIIKYFIAYLGVPLVLFDKILKTNSFVRHYEVQILTYILPPNYSKSHTKQVIFFQLIPRGLLLIMFLIDVFYFNRLHYFYYALFLALFPMLYNYYKFSMRHAKELAIERLEASYEFVDIYEEGWAEPRVRFEYNEYDQMIEIPTGPEWKPHPRNKYHEKMVSVREYIQIALDKELYDIENEYNPEDDYTFEPCPLSKDFRYKTYKKLTGKTTLDESDYKCLHEEFHLFIKPLINLMIYLHYLPKYEAKSFIKNANITFFYLSLIGWGYILIISLPNLKDIPITLSILNNLSLYFETINPFITP